MLRLVGLTAQATLIFLAAYNAVTALWGWRNPRLAPRGPRFRPFRILVPAHNEEAVIGALLEDLSRVDYAAESTRITVLADRCSDATVDIATEAGVSIVERKTGSPGKGAALAWYLERHPLEFDEALVVLDADNRVPSELLGRLADELDSGSQVLQCYLDVTDPEASLLAEASALSYWAGNRMVQLARTNLGWSADLGGTGMVFTREALEAVGGFTDSLTEDQELGVRLLLSGRHVEWLHDVRIKDEKPSEVGVAVRQRARWMAGKRAARRRHIADLLRNPSPANLDMALRLTQPGRSFVALLSAILTIAAVLTGSRWFLDWRVWGLATAVQVLEPLPFLARDGVETKRLLRYPVVALLGALWVPIRILSTRVTGWYHTPHKGS